MNTKTIINAINTDFAATYKAQSKFLNSGKLWDFCIRTISNPIYMSNIIFANALKIAPVKALLVIYRIEEKPSEDFKFSTYESQCLGALMGFIFQNVFLFKKAKDRCSVNMYGVQTATRFEDGPDIKINLYEE